MTRETETVIRNLEREISMRETRIQIWEERNKIDRAEIERLLSGDPEIPKFEGGGYE